MKVILTGASGLLGRAVYAHFKAQGAEGLFCSITAYGFAEHSLQFLVWRTREPQESCRNWIYTIKLLLKSLLNRSNRMVSQFRVSKSS